MSKGIFILITGFSGAGKTTLAKAALQTHPQWHYHTTVTTRPPRPDEIAHGTHEYEFVSEAEYTKRRTASHAWDHTEYGDHNYGADITAANHILQQGGVLLCSVAPDQQVIGQMRDLYATQPLVVWIDTPLPTANQRIAHSGDRKRAARQEEQSDGASEARAVRAAADAVFTPTGDLDKNEQTFSDLLQRLVDQKQHSASVS